MADPNVAVRRFGIAVLVVGILLGLAGLVLLFAAMWAHGHDLPSRLAGSGILALFVGSIATLSGWVLTSDA